MRHGHRVGEKLFVEHAGAGPQAARQGHGRGGVQVVERWILAAHRQLFFLNELNAVSTVLLERLTRRPLKRPQAPCPSDKSHFWPVRHNSQHLQF